MATPLESLLKKKNYILIASINTPHSRAFMHQAAKQGWLHLYGIGKNKSVYDLPDAQRIKYSIAEKDDTHFPDNFFDAVVDLSSSPAIDEAYRILDADSLLILRHTDIEYLKSIANGKFSFTQKGDYTLGYVQKNRNRRPKRISIIVETLKKAEGLKYTTKIMQQRLRENGVDARLYAMESQVPEGTLAIREWMPYMRLPKRKGMLIEAHDLPLLNNIGFSWMRIFSSYRYWLLAPIYAYKFLKFEFINKRQRNRLWSDYSLVCRSNELAKKAQMKRYTIMPHCLPISQEEIDKLPREKQKEICIGAYGFAAWYKRFDLLCDIAVRLHVKALLLLSINENNRLAVLETEGNIKKLKQKYGKHKNITIKVGKWSNERLRTELTQCTHFIQTQAAVDNVSSSARFMASFGKPIIALDTYQAREAQLIRVKSLHDITRKMLETTRNMRINMDDGTRYMIKILEAEYERRSYEE